MPNKADTVSRLRSGKQSIVFLSSAFEIHRFKHFLISKMTAKTQSCSWRFCLFATLLLGFIEYQIPKNIYDQSKITLCLAILVRVTCDTNSDKTSNSPRGGLSLHEELSGCDLLFWGPNGLFYFFFTSIYRHFVNNFTLFTKLLHSFQINNTDFIIIIIMTWTLFLRIEWRFPVEQKVKQGHFLI